MAHDIPLNKKIYLFFHWAIKKSESIGSDRLTQYSRQTGWAQYYTILVSTSLHKIITSIFWKQPGYIKMEATSSTTSTSMVSGDGSTVDSNRTSTSTSTTARSSMIDSLRDCGLSGIRIDKEDLCTRISIPQYLRLAMRRAINSKDVHSTDQSQEVHLPPISPMVVFINSRSGGRHGTELKLRLQQLMGEEQVSWFWLRCDEDYCC